MRFAAAILAGSTEHVDIDRLLVTQYLIILISFSIGPFNDKCVSKEGFKDEQTNLWTLAILFGKQGHFPWSIWSWKKKKQKSNNSNTETNTNTETLYTNSYGMLEFHLDTRREDCSCSGSVLFKSTF